MGRMIELRFVEAAVAVRAELLDETMPITCGKLARNMPLESLATHARYSGSEVAMLIDTSIRIEPENAIHEVSPGEVAYVWLNDGDHCGESGDISEICWFYAADAAPRMWEGPVYVNVFARIVGDAEAFYKASADTRITGQKTVRISLLEEES